jgi:glycosyltransferase involved in cell wall biosynthesis
VIRDHARSCGARSKNITVLPNAANRKFFRVPLVSNNNSSPFTVGFVGTLKPWHGVIDLLIAFKIVTEKIENSRLLIVGDGPERKRLESRARRLDLDEKVEWIGEVKHKDIPGYLSKMDAVVLPYPKLKRFYFSPLKLFEYMASGRAIIASSIGQLKEILDDKKTALLYKPGYVEALANHIITLESDPSLRSLLGKNARKAVKNRTWENNASVILKMFSKLK